MKPLATMNRSPLKKSLQQLSIALMASTTLMLAPSAMAADRDAAGFPPETGATGTTRGADSATLPRSAERDRGTNVRDAADDAGDRMSAAWVRGKIEGAYLFNRELNPLDIDVDVDNGTVTLSGDVDSDTHKDLAREIALSIEGVDRVNNELTVNSEARNRNNRDANRNDDRGLRGNISDGAVTAHVKAKLLANTNVSGTDVEVSTEDGKVTLSGQVDTSEEKDLAQYIANNTAGVRDVDNNLQVRAD